MSTNISNVLFGKTRASVLRLLYGQTDKSFYLRQVARHADTSAGAVQRELEQLVRSGLVQREAIGNQVFFRANLSSPLFSEIRSLVAKTVGIVGVLRSALQPLADHIQLAFIYGSVARKEETAASDIDLMVIGKITLPELVRALRQSGASVTLGREVNPTLYSSREFKSKLAKGNHFLTSLASEEKLFLIGTDDDLRELGTKRVA